jgi:hypothetical protein
LATTRQRQGNFQAGLVASRWDISGVAHPVRLQLLQALLSGAQTKAALEQLEGIGTTGQLYHHLKALEEGGWVRSLIRGT